MVTALITEQCVADVASALKAEGKAVTYRAIRDRIGGASPRAILAHLRALSVKEANTLSPVAGPTMTTGEVERYLREATNRIEAIFCWHLSGELARIIEDFAGTGAHPRRCSSLRLRRNRNG